MEIVVKNLEDIDRAADEFVRNMDQDTVFAFRGDMGVGKTTFISAVCRRLGVDTDDVSSPTFAIISEYRSDTTAELIYHFDMYRIENEDEALDAGVEDYFYSGALCFVEWPEKIADLLPGDTVFVDIRENPDGSRTLTTSDR